MPDRIFLIVLDSFGIGGAPDAAAFGDEGSDTLGAVRKSPFYNAPNLERLGLLDIDGVPGGTGRPAGSFARLRELSAGKDTTAGHWELAGLVSGKRFPTYPEGFPDEVISEFERLAGRKVLCNKPYSGTEVIRDYGRRHMETGELIVYTSADSVFQIAAHTDVVPLPELYRYCEIARKMLRGKHGVGRVIARPFTGTWPDYVRTPDRRDYSLPPPSDTLTDVLKRNGLEVIGVGKIEDIFAGRGLTDSIHTRGNAEGMDVTERLQDRDFRGLCFVNLVDFDALYGHRNNIDGYAKAISRFDARLPDFLGRMRSGDVLILTADHGCDPSTPSTDHSREDVPMLACGRGIKAGVNLGTREFPDVSATVLDAFGIENGLAGRSFYGEMRAD